MVHRNKQHVEHNSFMIAQSQTFLPWWFTWFMIAIATFFLVAIMMAVFYNQFGEAAGRRQTLQAAPFAVLVVVLVAALLPSFDTDRFAVWFLPLFVVLHVWGFFSSRRREQQAGAVLLDIGGREHRQGQMMLYTVVLVLMLVVTGLAIATEGRQSARIGMPVLLVVQNAIFL